jgi:hypothetical protein
VVNEIRYRRKREMRENVTGTRKERGIRRERRLEMRK